MLSCGICHQPGTVWQTNISVEVEVEDSEGWTETVTGTLRLCPDCGNCVTVAKDLDRVPAPQSGRNSGDSREDHLFGLFVRCVVKGFILLCRELLFFWTLRRQYFWEPAVGTVV